MRTAYKIIGLSAALGIILWVLGAELHQLSHPGSSLVGMLWNDLSASMRLFHVIVLISVILFGSALAAHMVFLEDKERDLLVANTEMNHLLDSIGVTVLVIGSDGTIRRANRHIRDVFGIEPEEAVGASCRDIVGSLLCETDNCPLCALNAVKDYTEVETVAAGPGGREITCLVNASPFVDENGEILGIVESIRDISVYKRSLASLHRYRMVETLLGAVSQHITGLSASDMDVGIEYVLRMIGTLEDVDRAYVFLFEGEDGAYMSNTHEWCAGGIPPEKDNLQNIPVSASPNWMRSLTTDKIIRIPRVSELPPSWEPERKILEAQDIQSLLCVPLFRSSELIGYIGFDSVKREKAWPESEIRHLHILAEIIVAALERRELEQQLEAEHGHREHLERIVNRSPAIAFTWLAENGWPVEFVSANIRQFGYEPEEYPAWGRSYLSIVHPEDREHLVSDIDAAARNGETGRLRQEYRIRAADGSVYWVAAHVWLYYGSSGTATHYQGIILDITQRKRAEEELNRIIGELEEKNRELDQFASLVSHDLKSPLRGIDSIAYWLAGDYAALFDDEGKRLLAQLNERIERMDNLIDGILRYSRAGRTMGASEPVDMDSLVREVVDTVNPPDTVRVTIDSPLPVLRFERTKLYQLMENLVNNAVKYLDKPEGRITIAAREEPGAVVITVEDNGCGMDGNERERVFSMFATGGHERSGTGIGLAIVKKIVDTAGGHISLDSTPGKGSRFSIRFPRGMVKTRTRGEPDTVSGI